MGLFSRTPHAGRSPVVGATPDDLARIGQTAFGGNDPYPPGLQALSTGELVGYVMEAMASADYPAVGSPEWASLRERFLGGLLATAERAGDWGYVGALCIAIEFVTGSDLSDPLYVEIADRALVVLRDDGVPYSVLPPMVLDRWQQVHGFDGLRPAGWPSSLETRSVPPVGSEPAVDDLQPGKSRRLAQPHAGEQSNVIYAERRDDSRIVAVIDGLDEAGVLRQRWEWKGVSADDYQSFLRALGEALVTPSHWAHPDLAPYFPCRLRSRDELRIEAAGGVGGTQ